MKTIKNISLLFFTLIAYHSYGQFYTSKANTCYKDKDYTCAKTYVDSAVTSNERFNSQTWQLRGLVYRKLESDENMDFRDISIESFVQARNLDSTGVYADQILNFLRNTIIRYYNDAVVSLENGAPDYSENSYVLYKGKYKKYIDPNFNFEKSDLEYYGALGGEYLKQAARLHGSDKDKMVAKGVHFYQKVQKINDQLFQPNFNVGITYYNQGADLIMNMDPLTDIDSIPVIEARAQSLFVKALPYLNKAHELDKDRIDVIEAITGCYYGLQDNDNYLIYQTILDKKNLPILLTEIEKDSKNVMVLKELCRIYGNTLKDQELYKKYYQMLEKAESEE
jgi:tetratricopeptide (TPR) repeat protein